MLGIAALAYSFEDHSLLASYYIHPVPLEECVDWEAFARHDVATLILWLHRVARYTDQELRTLECRYIVILAIISHNLHIIA